MFWIRLRNFINLRYYQSIMILCCLVSTVIIATMVPPAAWALYFTAALVISVLLVTLLKPIARILIREQQRREDRTINRTFDAAGEKRFTRSLTGRERKYLRRNLKKSKNLVKNKFWNGIFIGICIGIFTWFPIRDFIPIPIPLLLIIEVLVVVSISTISTRAALRKSYLYYLDLRTDAVMQVEGDLIREIEAVETKHRPLTRAAFVVRGLTFTSKEIPSIVHLYGTFSEDQNVRIEFSPHSFLVYRITSLGDPTRSVDLTRG